MLKSYLEDNRIEAGCDEAGRGCLAGPVFAAAVILSSNYYNPLLNDSKKLTHKQRLMLKACIEKDAVAFAVSSVSPAVIDQINILNASILAMHQALEGLSVFPDFLLIDGNRFKPFKETPHQCIVKGDSKYMSIAAASILAKTYRDEYMCNLASHYPQYHWENNKGYPTLDHRKAIAEYGASPIHRLSFKLTDQQIKIPFNK